MNTLLTTAFFSAFLLTSCMNPGINPSESPRTTSINSQNVQLQQLPSQSLSQKIKRLEGDYDPISVNAYLSLPSSINVQINQLPYWSSTNDLSAATSQMYTSPCAYTASSKEHIWEINIATDQTVVFEVNGVLSNGHKMDTAAFLLRGSDGFVMQCNDDINYANGNSDSRFTVELTAGTYYLVVEGYNGDHGIYTFNAQIIFPYVDDMLNNYTSLQNVKTQLQGYQADGIRLVKEILSGYYPGQSTDFEIEKHMAKVFDEAELTEEPGRVYLANVAHMLWLEHNRHFENNLDWSIENLTANQIDTYLVGSTIELGDPLHHYHFKFYGIAKEIVTRMQPYHPDISSNHTSAIARMVEYTGDNFMHYYSDGNVTWGSTSYMGSMGLDGVTDRDLSESFQRRLGGCGVPSYVSALLSRAINIPAVVSNPLCCNSTNQYDLHRYSYYPTIDKWVHGDAIVGTNTGAGLIGEILFWDPQYILNTPSSSSLFSSAMQANTSSRNELENQHNIHFYYGLKRSLTQTHSIFCANCTLLSSNFDEPYFSTRFQYYNLGTSNLTAGWLSFPVQKYRHLETIAAHWSFDGLWFEQNQVRESTLRKQHGSFTPGYVTLELNAMSGKSLGFSGNNGVSVSDGEPLRRNDEELSISLWVYPVSSGTLFERLDPTSPNEVYYALKLLPNGNIQFAYEREPDHAVFQLESTQTLTPNNWHHVVVTYSAQGELKIYIDDQLNNSSPANGAIPMAINSGYPTYTYSAYPAEIRMGSGGFVGKMDEVYLFFNEISANEVSNLYQIP